ncbi:MAG: hypothetical protein ABIP17_14615 [Ilumatobacteraceae bacterium]
MTTATTSPVHMLATIGDPDGTRTITSLVALLVALGLALVMVAIWLFKTTRPDPALLAPLEAMGERNWRRLDPVGQRRRLDALRPADADPIEPSVAPPEFDMAFDVAPSSPGFDDLQDDGNFSSDGEPVDSPLPQVPEPAVGAETPQQLDRPSLDGFDDGEIDPEVLAAARADLDAEMGVDGAVRQPATSESDLP